MKSLYKAPRSGSRLSRALSSASNTPMGFGSSAWVRTESTVSSGARRATSGSVMTGIWSGPTAIGVTTEPGGPIGTGLAHQVATARVGHITSSATGQCSRAYKVATYAGQLWRFRRSAFSWISTTTARTGDARALSVTTASARYSVAATSVRSAEDSWASSNAGRSALSRPPTSSAASAGRSRNISMRISCRRDGTGPDCIGGCSHSANLMANLLDTSEPNVIERLRQRGHLLHVAQGRHRLQALHPGQRADPAGDVRVQLRHVVADHRRHQVGLARRRRHEHHLLVPGQL